VVYVVRSMKNVNSNTGSALYYCNGTCVHSRWPNIEFITSNAITPYLSHPHSTGRFNSPYFYQDYGMWLSLQAIIVSFFFFKYA